MMKPTRIVASTLLVYFFATACENEPAKEILHDIPSLVASDENVEVVYDAPPAAESDNASLTQGTLTVFGLGLPRGMTPAKGPDEVYRFESNHPSSLVFGNVKDQVRAKTISEEGSGHLIRDASVMNPLGNATGDEVIAVRIKKRSGGGTVIDIWLEKEAGSRVAGTTRPSARGATRNEDLKTTTLPAAKWNRTNKAARRTTIKALEKLSRGERLTKEEQEMLN